jgi:hexosaminidase
MAAHGRRLIGWDEILEGGLPASASVMSWRGEQGAIDAANAGHDVVLSPAPTLYLDSLQSDRADEPPGRLSIMTLKDVYSLRADAQGHSARQGRPRAGRPGQRLDRVPGDAGPGASRDLPAPGRRLGDHLVT